MRVEIILWGDKVEVPNYEEISFERWCNIGRDLFQLAEDRGLEKPFIKLESTMEPYEDYLGDVRIVVGGYREETTEEKEDRLERDRISKKAKQLGITHYEVTVIEKLQKSGKLKEIK